MTAEEWPALAQAFERWLSPANFDADGRQRTSLARLTARVRAGLAAAPDDGTAVPHPGTPGTLA